MWGIAIVRRPSVNFFIFSSPEPKVQVNYCHHLASVVRGPLKIDKKKGNNFKMGNQIYFKIAG
jgi:hypothetical protein